MQRKVMNLPLQVLWFGLLSLLSLNESQAVDDRVCISPVRDHNEGVHKSEYRVGVLAIRGFDAAYTEFNKTFSDYLTATAGKRFDPPISFKLIPLNFIALFEDVKKATQSNGAEGVDFIYVNPSAFSCIESEYGANTLVSQISRRFVGGQVFHLTKFGGVIFTRSDNDAVNTIQDIRNKTVACASISGLGSGQMQFRLLQSSGLSYIQDPKQLVFTSNQGKVVNGVLNGDFDVGFVRTDQIERTRDSDGNLVDKSMIKIINGRYEELDGEPFPFESSTILYPEWNVASLPQVANDVAIEVQDAMLDLAAYADVGQELQSCYQLSNCSSVDANVSNTECRDGCWQNLAWETYSKACEATPELASLALEAKENGGYSGWRSTLSYMELRNMQEETNFIRKQPDGVNACVRSTELYDAIVCPPGHFRRREEEVLNGCTNIGLDCGEYQCLCKPCVEAFDVDVSPVSEINKVDGVDGACPKFAICGTVEQSKTITFRAIDNKEREAADLRVRVLEADTEVELTVKHDPTTNFSYLFSFDASSSSSGIVIFEVYAEGTQIPESPFRLSVTDRQCAEETGDPLREVDDSGSCICSSSSVEIGGNCVANAILIVSIVLPALTLLVLAVYLFVEHKRKQADSVWAVDPDELSFDSPPAILGRGTFGLVLLAEYRGTQVAVKRVIPPKVVHSKAKSRKLNGNSTGSFKISLLGEGDIHATDSYFPPEQRAVGTAFQFEFNESDLKTMGNELDAMESGVLPASIANRAPGDNESLNASSVNAPSVTTRRTSLTQGRRSSLGGSGAIKHEEARRRNSLFDFENLKDSSGGRSHHNRRASEGNLGFGEDFDGRESGAMNKLLAKLHQEQNLSVTHAVPKASRRHSIGGITGFGGIKSELTFGNNADRIGEDLAPRPKERLRRGSHTSIGSDASESEIEDAIMSNKQLFPDHTRVAPGSPHGDSGEVMFHKGNPIARRHSTGGGSDCLFAMPGPSKRRSDPGEPLDESQKTNSSNNKTNGSASMTDQHPNGASNRARRESESSWSVDTLDFKKLLELEATNDDSAPTLGAKSAMQSQLFKSSTSGSFGMKTDNEQNGWSFKQMADQVFGRADDYSRLKADFIVEMRHLSKLRHPCITTVMGAVISKRSEPMLVMEYMDHGSLYDLLHNDSMIVDGELVLPILRDIAQGVRFLHAANPQVIHGDLKAQNVLVDSKFRAKVADFGLSQKKRVGATGTPLWMAPELLRGESENTAMSDVYSFGIILYEVYSRKDPYDGENHLAVLRAVADPSVNKRPPVPQSCPPKVSSIMSDCLVGDPLSRPSFEELDLRLKRLDVENVEPGKMNFSMQKKKEQRAARSEELLFEVFPRHVAEALRDGRKVEAESFDCVSVFFSDIVGYTTISSKLHPRKVSDMLDRLYLKFDDLSTEHDIFKIETIGDAYMCVTNLHTDQADHAARMASFAIAAMEAASDTLIDKDDPSKGYVKIRIGIHSGPIVADVVGSRSPKYTLFGDTVNTASRMESTSLPLRIQCSDRTADLIKQQDPPLLVVSRGKIPIKGKGEMHTFWVNESDSLEEEVAKQNKITTDQQNRTLDAIAET